MILFPLIYIEILGVTELTFETITNDLTCMNESYITTQYTSVPYIGHTLFSKYVCVIKRITYMSMNTEAPLPFALIFRRNVDSEI